MLVLAGICLAMFACAQTVLSDNPAPRVVINQASGQLLITNSLAGQAIFQASGLSPGGSVTGTVQLANPGTLPGGLSLAQFDLQDQPGANGGRLSDALELALYDITGGSWIPLYAGELNSVGSLPLGNINPGESRVFRMTASLPDGGMPPSPTTGDNAYLGSRVTARYTWNATSPDQGGPGPDVPPPRRPDPQRGSPVYPTPKFSFRVDARALARRGRVDVLVSCVRACTIRTRAKVLGVKRVRIPHRSVMMPLPGKTGRIRLNLNSRSKAALRRAAGRRRSVKVKVTITVIPVGIKARSYTKTVKVKLPKRKRR